MPFERHPISKRLRFDVFKRDAFACQYCGASPPSVLLELDHVVPIASGGASTIDNLVTACFDCNRGKADGSLTTVPPSSSDKAAVLAERMAQLKAYNALLKKQADLLEKDVDAVDAIFSAAFPGYGLSDSFRVSVRRNFLSRMPQHEVCDAMAIACARMGQRDRAIKYFCGVCWNWIRAQSNPA